MLFYIAMPNNAHKYILLSDFTLAIWPLRGWPYTCTLVRFYVTALTVERFFLLTKLTNIYYTVAYLLFGGGVQEV